MRAADVDFEAVAQRVDDAGEVPEILVAHVDANQVVEAIGVVDQHGDRHLVANRLVRREHGREADRTQDIIEVPVDFVVVGSVTVPLVERVDLCGVDTDAGDHLDVVDHVTRRTRFDPHSANRHLSGEFLHPDFEQRLRLVTREDVALSAAASSEVDADAGIGHAAEMAPCGNFVQSSIGSERCDADDKGAGARRVR
jgi:cobalamin biosynthesis protein CbiD